MRLKPKKLIWLETIRQRGLLSYAEQRQYQRLAAGYEGENRFDQIFVQNAPKIQTFWDDVELEYCGRKTQMDKVVLHNRTLELLDFKNYEGNYQYADGRLFCKGKILPYNPFDQMNRAEQVYERLLSDYRLMVEVKGTIVFVNPSGKTEWQSPPPLQVIQYPQLPWWLSEWNENYQWPETYERCQEILLRHQSPRFGIDQCCSEERFAKLRKGFHCCKCGSFDTWFDRYALNCACGWAEAKEIAYPRSICEYGVIMHHKPLTRRALMEFLGEQASESYLRVVLRKHFDLEVNNKRGSYYQNKGIPFEEWFMDKQSYFKKIQRRVLWKK